ncbi:MAG TPA: Flp pilus assembly protein CpaB [Methylocystis sp.]|nr:Flp pilus assembly protein CpaB [Methylocystis sp.]
MNKGQIAVAGVALVAGVGAFIMMNRQGPAPQLPAVIAPVLATTDQVLVAKRDLTYGQSMNDPDFGWIEWPKSNIPKGVIVKSASPNAVEELRGSFVRAPITNGEPVRRERLVKGASPNMMSTLLSSGKRAVAIDVSANTTAGGFILPNDRVDIIRFYKDAELTKDRGAEVLVSELVVTNVRVLAVGQTVETKNGEAVVTGGTATLELDPHQAELVLLAQRTGTLAMELRPLVDAHPKDDAPQISDLNDGAMNIVRFGVTTSLRPR